MKPHGMNEATCFFVPVVKLRQSAGRTQSDKTVNLFHQNPDEQKKGGCLRPFDREKITGKKLSLWHE